MTYREAGVDLEAADRHVAGIAPLVTATWGPEVIGGFGGFAAGVELPEGYRRPVLMLSTDGVGTKLEIARRSGAWDGVGHDLVAMCVDDLAAVGARPLAFVDYLAVGALSPDRDTRIVGSIARACAEAGVALVGGETAEHPGVMAPDHVDLAGAALGVVEKGAEITGTAVRPDDEIIGVLSPNLRSNGFSLVRHVLRGAGLDGDQLGEIAGGGRTWADILLDPSVVYAPAVLAAVEAGGVHGMAHVTGGGIAGNLIRPLPDGCRAVIDPSAWEPPEVFDLVRRLGGIDDQAMFGTFNMGIGFCLVVDPSASDELLDVLGRHDRPAVRIGAVEAGDRGVVLR